MKFISEIKDTFVVKNRGVVACIILKDFTINIKVGDNLVITNKLGEQRFTKLKGIEIFRGDNDLAGILLDTNIMNTDVEKGDCIYWNET